MHELNSEASREDTAALPLAGLKVLEFCHTIMGPSAGMLLADLGADVIKVEPPEGDATRRMTGFASGFFYAFNRNKRGLSVDLKNPEGCALVRRLARHADVLLENFGPGTMERLGLGYEHLEAANPRLVYCALKGFLSGPYEHRPALDEVVQFMAGLAYMTGPPGQPLRAGASVIDIMGGMFGVIAVQAALRERERTGRGQFVRSALFESTAFLMTQHMAGQAVTGRAPPPMPARESAWAIYETFHTSDGQQIFIGITSDRHWRSFCETFARADLLADSRYSSNADRVRERSALRPIVADSVACRTLGELSELLDRVGIPFAPVAKPGDLFDDPQLNWGERMLEVAFPQGKHALIPRLPVEMDGHDLGLRLQAPALGEHTAEILREAGLQESEIESLRAANVVVCAEPPRP